MAERANLFRQLQVVSNLKFFIKSNNTKNSKSLFSKKKDLVIKTIQKGEYFGEDEFFTGAARSYSAKSLDFTTLVIIRRHEFLALLQAQRSQT